MKGNLERISWRQGDEIFKVDCLVRRSYRARRINMKLAEPWKVILTLPPQSSYLEGREFVICQSRWIREKSKKVPKVKSLSEFFGEGSFVWLDETPRRLEWAYGANDVGRFSSEIKADCLELVLSENRNLEKDLLFACMELAKDWLPVRLKQCEEKSGISSRKLRVGNQRSRWGSCSEKGTISLNWRVLLLPYEIGQYVIYHELVHLEHMNHSEKFWKRLKTIVPTARLMDKELLKLGRELVVMGQPNPWDDL